jgi:hypothetical protein
VLLLGVWCLGCLGLSAWEEGGQATLVLEMKVDGSSWDDIHAKHRLKFPDSNKIIGGDKGASHNTARTDTACFQKSHEYCKPVDICGTLYHAKPTNSGYSYELMWCDVTPVS